MAGIHKNIYKRKAMSEFGEEKGIGVPFPLSEILEFMCTYRGINGQIHKSVPTTFRHLSSLLRVHPSFQYLPSKEDGNMWLYMGDEEE